MPRKDVTRVLRAAERLGCEVSRGGTGRYRIRLPNGHTITCSETGERHAANALRRDLKRYGGLEITCGP